MRRLIPSFGRSARVPAAPSVKSGETGVITRGARLRPKIAFAAFGAIMVAATAGYTMLDRDRITNDIITFTGAAGLNLQYIEVRGRSHTPSDMLLAVSELKKGEPLLAIDLAALHGRIANIGWVQDVIIERRMPSTIRITMQERIPVALLQTPTGHRLIDQSGAEISGAKAENFAHLTVVQGRGAASQAGPILEILRTEPELFANVWAISLQSGRRWDVHLRNGIAIRLPENDPRTAWARLAIMDHKKQIIDRDLAVIDLRIPEQLIVEPNIPVRGKGRNT